MTTDEERNSRENIVSKVVLSEEAISKIKEFASQNSDGIEDADNLQNMLGDLVARIVLHCCTGENVSGSGKTDLVEVYVVPALEGLSVSIRVSDREQRECFKRGITQEEVENTFLSLLGFR